MVTDQEIESSQRLVPRSRLELSRVAADAYAWPEVG
jgi:hypothetical protein